MNLLKELLTEKKAPKVSSTIAHKVYHRDYLKTKNKKYRKYNPAKQKAVLKEYKENINKYLKQLNEENNLTHQLVNGTDTHQNKHTGAILHKLAADAHAWTMVKGILMSEDKEEVIKRLARVAMEHIPHISMGDAMKSAHEIADMFWGEVE